MSQAGTLSNRLDILNKKIASGREKLAQRWEKAEIHPQHLAVAGEPKLLHDMKETPSVGVNLETLPLNAQNAMMDVNTLLAKLGLKQHSDTSSSGVDSRSYAVASVQQGASYSHGLTNAVEKTPGQTLSNA